MWLGGHVEEAHWAWKPKNRRIPTTSGEHEFPEWIRASPRPDHDCLSLYRDTENKPLFLDRKSSRLFMASTFLVSLLSKVQVSAAYVTMRAVRNIQRNVLLRLSGAYRTVAMDVLCLALGIWPLDLLSSSSQGRDHGPYPESLWRMGLVESEACECGEVGTPEHVVLECARTAEIGRPNQQEVQGRLVGGVLTEPTKWRLLDRLAAEATERAKTEYRRVLRERRRLRQRDNRRRVRPVTVTVMGTVTGKVIGLRVGRGRTVV
uniref:Reverse transcriptase n=1 Tax=Timema douglasi TaxID=61478 RepID=A0A7R8VV82_TIMDO|nr:unnamed protein product [Timema douglasi]